MRDHVEVARRRAAGPGLALAGQADAAALTHARGDLHAESLRLVHEPRAAAGRARVVDDRAAPAAARAGLGDGEHPLPFDLDAATVALGTGAWRRAGLGAAARARRAGLLDRNADRYLRSP